jgi:flagellum-specific peptidoglycan hydrolase FlgJ
MANQRYTEAEFNAMDNATLIKTLDAYKNDKPTYEFRDWVPVKVKVRYFVSKYGKGIGNAIKGTGLFFSAVVAQKMLESGYGKSDLAFYHNNFGGIKAVQGYPKVTLDTTEVVRGKKVNVKQNFAKYPSPQSAFNDYVRIITTSPRYAKALLADSPEKQISELAKAGYTTTPPTEYLNSMKGNIDRVRDMYQVGRIA